MIGPNNMKNAPDLMVKKPRPVVSLKIDLESTLRMHVYEEPYRWYRQELDLPKQPIY